ncbi:MAG: hypothetical protein KDK36_04130, partial [Leptospiraceae bacterium]|nr:hypothetical protein [Leptospiraceae bacterium]
IESTNSNKYETWVTIVPELKNFCSKLNLPEEELILRVNQYLGLLPDSKRNYLNSIWVSPKDLFRPCHDPEITDSKCDLDYPKNVSKDHKKWFEKAKEDNKKYPWTRLGYTADWGKDEPYIGASEFLIRKGAAIEVESVKTVKEYCSGE